MIDIAVSREQFCIAFVIWAEFKSKVENSAMNISGPLRDDDRELAEKQEELQAQKEELTAAIEELVSKNNYLTETLAQLQKRNEELDLLLYKTSHDLKSPISSLQGLLHLLGLEELTDSQRQLLEFMDQKTAQMNDTLRSLNMLSQASFEKIKFSKIRLDEAMRSALKDLKYLPDFQSVEVHVEYNSLKTVYTDEQALYNILKCLIANAIIYREPTRVGKVAVLFDEKNASFIIEVTDDGEGISPEIGSEIFKMFYRGSERSHGSGLGLYIVKVVVDRLKGNIRWISRPGSTTFQVVLPRPDLQINSL